MGARFQGFRIGAVGIISPIFPKLTRNYRSRNDVHSPAVAIIFDLPETTMVNLLDQLSRLLSDPMAHTASPDGDFRALTSVPRFRPLALQIGTRRINALLPLHRITSLSLPLIREAVDHIRDPLVARSVLAPAQFEAWPDLVTRAPLMGVGDRAACPPIFELVAEIWRQSPTGLSSYPYDEVRSTCPFYLLVGVLLLWGSSRAMDPRVAPPPLRSLARSPPNLSLSIRDKSITSTTFARDHAATRAALALASDIDPLLRSTQYADYLPLRAEQ